MRLELFTPVSAGQSATCRVYGADEPGYIMVKVNGAVRNVLPDAHPGVPSQRRLVFAPATGQGYDVWTDPPWKAGDNVEFELYPAVGPRADAKPTVVV
jgi:hypothetical protein